MGVLYQGPDGTLGSRVQSHPVGADRVVAVDLDRDASPDLVTTNRDPFAANPLLWDVPWRFTLLGGQPLSFSPDRLAAADLNRDGRQDVVIGGDGSTEFGVALGNGDGSFGTPSVTTTTYGVRGLATGDFDRDGKVDLVTRESNTLVVRAGDGAGGYLGAIDAGRRVGCCVGHRHGRRRPRRRRLSRSRDERLRQCAGLPRRRSRRARGG